MARKPRIHYEGALYHVICRGNNREYVYKESYDKEKYLEIIKRYKKRHNFKLYSYCLMDNHVHLLIEVGDVPLSKIMQCIQQVYTQYYNRKHLHTGHVFEQRYKAILCDKDQYLLSLISYIHQNPSRAGFKKGIDYEWSSHKSYVEGRSAEFIDIEFPLSLFGDKNVTQIKKYADFLKIKETKIKGLTPRELSEEVDEYKKIKEQGKEQQIITATEVVEKVCKHYNVEMNQLRNKSHKVNDVKVRKVMTYILRQYTKRSNKEIAELLNVSQSTISNILSDTILKSCYLEEINEVIKL